MDTLTISKKLIATGLKPEQAEVIAQTIKEEVAIKNDELVTKGDLKDLELILEKRFVRLEFFMAIMLAILVIPVLKDLLG